MINPNYLEKEMAREKQRQVESHKIDVILNEIQQLKNQLETGTFVQ